MKNNTLKRKNRFYSAKVLGAKINYQSFFNANSDLNQIDAVFAYEKTFGKKISNIALPFSVIVKDVKLKKDGKGNARKSR